MIIIQISLYDSLWEHIYISISIYFIYCIHIWILTLALWWTCFESWGDQTWCMKAFDGISLGQVSRMSHMTHVDVHPRQSRWRENRSVLRHRGQTRDDTTRDVPRDMRRAICGTARNVTFGANWWHRHGIALIWKNPLFSTTKFWNSAWTKLALFI